LQKISRLTTGAVTDACGDSAVSKPPQSPFGTTLETRGLPSSLARGSPKIKFPPRWQQSHTPEVAVHRCVQILTLEGEGSNNRVGFVTKSEQVEKYAIGVTNSRAGILLRQVKSREIRDYSTRVCHSSEFAMHSDCDRLDSPLIRTPIGH
jgi:hypothetical protein